MSTSPTPPSPLADSTPAADRPGVGGSELFANADASAASGSSTAVTDSSDPGIEEYEELTPELVEDEAIRGDFVIKWAVVLLAFLLASTKVGESLSLVSIKTGQYLASHGFLPPRTDVFSSTATDRAWPNLAWGFDLVLGAVYSAGGFVGVSVFKALLVMLTFAIVAQIVRPNLPTWWSSICAALALLACHLRFAPHSTLITFLGLSLLFLILTRYRQRLADHARQGSPRLWLLIPLFVLWCNFDSRAYLGLACLLLYAAGESLAGLLKTQNVLPSETRGHLWTVALACVAASFLHPFPLQSGWAPGLVYGTEYPAIREYVTQAYLGEPRPIAVSEASYFPLSSGGLWMARDGYDYAGLAAIVVVLAGIVLVLFNWKRMAWGETLAFFGMLGFAVLCLRELPAAALVAAIVAGLNGQAWYQNTFSQAYTTRALELLFSRAGRAATVLALAVIGFFGGTGRLRDAAAPQSGYGLDNNLASLIGDLETRLVGLPTGPAAAETGIAAPVTASTGRSFDDRPFNYAVSHGDVLVWIGQKPFIDSRLFVYHDRDEERNLLATNLRVRQALELVRAPRSSDPTQGRTLRPNDAALIARQRSERREYWTQIFDQYAITHVLLRLSTTGRAAQEVLAFTDLLNADPPTWELTDLGAGCAVLYRADVDNPDLRKFLDDRTLDFRNLAFQRSAPFLSARDRWVRKPTFYQRYFWSKRRDIAPSIQQALQYARLATLPGQSESNSLWALPDKYANSRAALAILAIRKAQEGLQDDPDSHWGYMVLGEAYGVLAKWEATLAQNPTRTQTSGLRYFQSMSSYNQVLVSSPDDAPAHQQLSALYAQANRSDLELRHQRSLLRLFEAEPEIDTEILLSVESRIRELEKRVEKAEEADLQFQQQQRPAYDRAMELAQQGFVLQAIGILDKEAEARTGNLSAEQLRIILQIEAGQAEEAQENAERFAAPAQEAGLQSWEDPVAFANLPNADYPRAQTLWSQKNEQASKGALTGLLYGLVPRPKGLAGWPLAATNSAATYSFTRPETICETRINLALIYLEEGNLASAQREFEQALAAHPETGNRNLILYYLSELRGEEGDEEDPFSPSQTIPGEFASEEEFSQREKLVDEFLN